MADVKISELPAASALDGTESMPVVQGGVTKRTTTQDIADLSGGGGAPTITVGIVPHAGGGQASATQLSYGYNVMTEPASDGDSVQLPAALAKSVVTAFNAQADAVHYVGFFAKNGTSDTINGQPNSTQFDGGSGTSGLGKIWTFVCATNGAWFCNLGID